MTSRERVAALLAGELPDRVPVHEALWPETIGEAWVRQGYPTGVLPEDHFGYDVVDLGSRLNLLPFPDREERLAEDERSVTVRNGAGATLRFWKGRSGTPEHLGFECVSPEVWARYREPLLDFDRTRIDPRLAAHLELAAAGDRFVIASDMFLFELLRSTLGDVVMLESFLLQPDWIRDFCRVYTDFFKVHYDWIFTHLGKPDGIYLNEDLAFSHGPFCSPATYDALVRPFHVELVDFFHSHDLPVILHSCGDVRQLFSRLCADGWDCLEPMEAKAGNHVLDYADQTIVGGKRLGFMGNIDVTVLLTNDREKVREEVVGKVAGMVERRVGYCFHSDHSVPPEVDYETYCYALELVREHGEYPSL